MLTKANSWLSGILIESHPQFQTAEEQGRKGGAEAMDSLVCLFKNRACTRALNLEAPSILISPLLLNIHRIPAHFLLIVLRRQAEFGAEAFGKIRQVGEPHGIHDLGNIAFLVFEEQRRFLDSIFLNDLIGR